MNNEETERDEHPGNAHYPLAETPQARYEQYTQAVQFVDQFENQYSPKLTYDTEDFTKVTYWDDEHGSRHYEHEDITIEEKEALDNAWKIIAIYEEHYRDEWNRGDEGIAPLGERQAIKEMGDIREHDERSNDRDRLAQFDRTTTEQENRPISGEITAIHPDGFTTLHATTPDGLVQGIVALYSDGHGDFGLYDDGRASTDFEIER